MALLPEDYVLPEIYYNEERARQYEKNTRIQKIQREMTSRALEILELKPPASILDLGCGTGISMQVLKEAGFTVKGVDIAKPMLAIALQKGLDVYEADFTVKIPFDSGNFDADELPTDAGDLKGDCWLVGKFLAIAQVAAMAYVTYKGYPEVLGIPVATNLFSWLRERARFKRTGSHYDSAFR